MNLRGSLMFMYLRCSAFCLANGVPVGLIRSADGPYLRRDNPGFPIVADQGSLVAVENVMISQW